jgi:hypothetical protein
MTWLGSLGRSRERGNILTRIDHAVAASMRTTHQ